MFSTEQVNARPELAWGPNPLIEAAEPFIPFNQLARRIERRPLDNTDWRQIQPAAREALLDYAELHFVSTGLVLEPVAGIQRLFRRTLTLGNPLNPEARARTFQVAAAQAPEELRRIPALAGAGAMWAGITGMGKSSIAHRVLEVICPRQVIVHEANERAGWLRCVQCCYLYVDHASNGTRGGLLYRILEALDKQLGTDYSAQHRTTRNLDVLLVVVTKQLVLHRVALLVIDENQAQNFAESPWQMQFILFYLSLMNLGISVLLMGNPLAFMHLKTFTQVTRRFSVGGIFDFEPAQRDESWWRDDFVPQKQLFSLVDKCTVEREARLDMAYEASGGVPGLFEAFDIEAQRSALRGASSSAILTMEDFQAAKVSPRYKELLEIGSTLGTQDAGHSDIRDSASGTPSIPHTAKRAGASAVDVVSSLLSRYKAEQSRLTGLLQQKLRVLDTLTEDDVRMLGVSEDMLGMLTRGTPYAKGVEKRKAKGAAK